MVFEKQLLPPKRREVLEKILLHYQRTGVLPSVQELQTQCRVKSLSTTHYHLRCLQADGFITTPRYGVKRSMTLNHDALIRAGIISNIPRGIKLLSITALTAACRAIDAKAPGWDARLSKEAKQGLAWLREGKAVFIDVD